jgi:septum formation topological specificity factor MinE
VVSRYVELDQNRLQLSLASEGGTADLIANLPIRRVNGEDPEPEAELTESAS